MLTNEKIKKYLKRAKEHGDIDDDDKIWRIIQSNDDDLKKQSLEKVENLNVKALIIMSFSNDDLKKYYLKDVNEEGLKTVIINSFSSDELKAQYVRDITDESCKSEIIKSFSSDELKAQYVRDITDESCKSEIIKSFSSDELKAQYVRDITDESCKFAIISSFSSDELKLKYLTDDITDIAKAVIIRSFSRDDLKLKYLADNITDDYSKAVIISSFSSDELKLEYLANNIIDDRTKAKVISSFSSDELKKSELDKIAKAENKATVIKTFDNTNYAVDLINSGTFSYSILSDIIHSSEKFMTDDFINKIKDKLINSYALYYNIEKEEADSIYECFGNAFFISGSKNAHEFFYIPKLDREKILKLFQVDSLNEDKINTINNVLIQYEFLQTQGNIVNTFANLKNLIDNNDKTALEMAIKKIVVKDRLLKKDDLKKMLKNLGYNLEEMDFSTFFSEFIDDVLANKNTDQFQNYLDILHSICNIYVAKEREEYYARVIDTFNSKLNYSSRPNKKKLIDKARRSLDLNSLLKFLNSCDLGELSKGEQEVANNEDILKACLEFYKNHKNPSKYLGPFNRIMEKLYNRNLLDDYSENDMLEPSIPDAKNKFKIFCDLDLDEAKKLCNSPDYAELLNFIKKYNMTSWGDFFDIVLLNDNFSDGEEIISSIINNFSRIKAKTSGISDKDSLIARIKAATAYSSHSPLYSYLIGADDLFLLKANPSPNSSGMSFDERLKSAAGYVEKMYQRSYVTVPSVDEKVEVDNGNKQIRVVSGNCTDMINLTYGERTGACMRIGGAASGLFDFCITNDNGFHVRFVDPDTGEFIGRVSGFRNGNTVFLNELRNSVMGGYSDGDLIEACYKVAEMFIEKSKDKDNPIENVVISQNYAMKKLSNQVVSLDLNGTSVTDGYGYLYTDIRNSAIVLATIGDKKKPKVDLKVKLTDKDRYPTLRQPIVSYSGNTMEARSHINRLLLINQILKEGPQSLGAAPILSEEENVMSAIIGEDWFYYVNGNGMTCEFILENIPEENRKRAEKELKKTKLEMAKAALEQAKMMMEGSVNSVRGKH